MPLSIAFALEERVKFSLSSDCKMLKTYNIVKNVTKNRRNYSRNSTKSKLLMKSHHPLYFFLIFSTSSYSSIFPPIHLTILTVTTPNDWIRV